MDAAREELLERFRIYLERGAPDGGPDEPDTPDLFSLLSELSGLRNEVRLESRQMKVALEQFRELFDGLRDANEQLSAELAHRRRLEREQVEEAERALLLELIELRARLSAGLDHAAGYRPGRLARWGGAGELVAGLAQGMAMNLRRLDESLERRGVHRVETVGRPYDPQTMQAVEVVCEPGKGANQVTSEVRAGYRRGEKLLRTAEVIVNQEGRKQE